MIPDAHQYPKDVLARFDRMLDNNRIIATDPVPLMRDMADEIKTLRVMVQELQVALTETAKKLDRATEPDVIYK